MGRVGGHVGLLGVRHGDSGRPPAEHSVHLYRRSRRARLELLRLEDQPHAQPRPDRQTGHAVSQLLLHEFNLRSQPGRHSLGQAQSFERVHPQRQHVRRFAADVSQAAAQGRLPNGHDRQVASAEFTHRFRSLAGADRPGTVLQPADARERPKGRVKHVGYTTDIITDKSLSTGSRTERDPNKPFHVDVPAQGAAPELAAGSEAPDALRRRNNSRTRQSVRRLQRPRTAILEAAAVQEAARERLVHDRTNAV